MNLLSSNHISVIVLFIKTLEDYYNFISTYSFLYKYSQQKRIHKQNMKRLIKLQFFQDNHRDHIVGTFRLNSPKINFKYDYDKSEEETLELLNAVKTSTYCSLIGNDYNTIEIEVKNNRVYFYTNLHLSTCDISVSIKCKDCVDAIQEAYNSFN